MQKNLLCMSGFQRVCVHLYEVPQDSECSSQNYWLIIWYVKVFFVSRCQMKHEGDHHHLPQPLWCWFNEEMGNRKRNGENSPCVQCSTPKHQISVRVLLEKDSDVTALNTLMGFFFTHKEPNKKGMMQIQDILNKEVKRGLNHLFQATHNFMLFRVPASLQGGVCSL